MPDDRRPCALTQGDPSGVGPEITLRAWLKRDQADVPPFFVLTDPAFLRGVAQALGWPVPVEAVAPEEAPQAFARALPVVPLGSSVAAVCGRPDPACGTRTRTGNRWTARRNSRRAIAARSWEDGTSVTSGQRAASSSRVTASG